jgi:hypothetical protein
MVDLYAVEGNSADEVETYPNVPASPDPDAVVEISPDRGLFLRIANAIAKASRMGVPVYMKLRDADGNHIPTNTSAYFALEVQGMEEAVKVSEKKGNLSFYSTNDITTQRDTDNVDGALFELQEPETEGGDTISALRVRDIDALYFKIDSAAEVDWNNSEWYIDSEATDEREL